MLSKMDPLFQSFNVLGAGVSYLVGPLAVPYNGPNSSIIETKQNIQIYMIGLAAAAAGIFLGKLSLLSLHSGYRICPFSGNDPFGSVKVAPGFTQPASLQI